MPGLLIVPGGDIGGDPPPGNMFNVFRRFRKNKPCLGDAEVAAFEILPLHYRFKTHNFFSLCNEMRTEMDDFVAADNAIWSEDLLDRQGDARFLIDFLVRKIAERGKLGKTRSFVLNIDATWGDGKTFFLSNLKRSLEVRGHVVAFVNAWADDHADDPLLAIISAIEGALAEGAGAKPKKPLSKLSQIAGQVVAAGAKGLVKQTATRLIGEGATQELAALLGDSITASASSAGKEAGVTAEKLFDEQGKALVEKFRTGQRSVTEFKKELVRVLQGPMLAKRSLPLFVLVDELDRCRPNYAVSLLERMKHLFEIDDVVFVMATDTGQLQHSIRALYGIGFDSTRYLFRFFDQTYRFAKPLIQQFIKFHFADMNLSAIIGPAESRPDDFCAYTFNAFSLPLRDQLQCIDILRNCVTVWRSPCPIQLFALLPLIVAQQRQIDVDYTDLQDRLTSALGKKQGIDWPLDFKVFAKGTSRREVFPGWAILDQVITSLSHQSVVGYMNSYDHEGASTKSRIVYDLARFEFDHRREGMKRDAMSLILEYPRLVQSVGRLSPT